MKRKKVFIAHNSINFIKMAQKFFETNPIYSFGGHALDGQSLLNVGNLDNFDVVIVKNALTYVSGLYALDILLKNTRQRPDIIILVTPFINEFVENKCNSLGIDFIPDIKIEENKVTDIIYISELNKQNRNKVTFDTSAEIIRYLKQVGLLRTYIGYTYFEYILNQMFEKIDYIYKPMKDLYVIIAQHFNVTTTSVEKAMRTCIKSSFAKNNSYYSRLLFGHNIKNNDFPPTSMFLQVSIKTLKELKQSIINNNIKNSLRKI